MTRPQAYQLANELHGVGFPPSVILKQLAQQGFTTSKTTVLRWTRPEFAERRRAAQRKPPRTKDQGATPEFKLKMLREWRDAGLSWAAVQVLLGITFGDGLTHDQVQYAYQADRYPKNVAPYEPDGRREKGLRKESNWPKAGLAE